MGEWMWPQPGRHQFGVELYGNGNGCKKSLRQDGRMRRLEGRKAMPMDASLVVAQYGDGEAELMVVLFDGVAEV